jgi:hypothetical protein
MRRVRAVTQMADVESDIASSLSDEVRFWNVMDTRLRDIRTQLSSPGAVALFHSRARTQCCPFGHLTVPVSSRCTAIVQTFELMARNMRPDKSRFDSQVGLSEAELKGAPATHARSHALFRCDVAGLCIESSSAFIGLDRACIAVNSMLTMFSSLPTKKLHQATDMPSLTEAMVEVCARGRSDRRHDTPPPSGIPPHCPHDEGR